MDVYDVPDYYPEEITKYRGSHFLAGIRHLVMDLHIGMALKPSRQSAAVVLVLALVLTLAVAVKLW